MHNVKNSASAAVTADSGATITVAADNFPAAPFYLTELTGLETVEVTAKAGTVFTVNRAVYGTQTTLTGKTVELRLMAEHIIEVTDGEAIVKPVQDWVTDTKNLQDAFASGKPVKMHPGTFYLEGSGTEILLLNNMVKVSGAGKSATTGTSLMVRSTVPTTRDVIRIASNSKDARSFSPGLVFEDFRIVPQVQSYLTNAGRNLILFDFLTANTTNLSPISQAVIQRLHLEGGQKSLKVNNPGPGNGGVGDGYFGSVIKDCEIYGGITFIGLGDSNVIQGNTITNVYDWNAAAGYQVGPCIDIQGMIDGANVVAIRDNNMTNDDTIVRVANSLRVNLENNNIEAWTCSGGTGAAVVEYSGGIGTPSGRNERSNIIGNQIVLLSQSSRNIAVLKIDGCDYTTIQGNNLHNAKGGVSLLITGNCTGTILHPYQINTGTLSDSGVSTKVI